MFSVENFIRWLLTELDKKGWQPSDLAKQAKVSKGSVSNVLNGNRKPGPDLCLAIAKALNEPPEKVFRLAGLLPALPTSDGTTIQEAIELLKNLPPEQQQEALSYIRYLYQRDER